MQKSKVTQTQTQTQAQTYEPAYIAVPNYVHAYGPYGGAPEYTLAIWLDFNTSECKFVVADKDACIGKKSTYELVNSGLKGCENLNLPATRCAVEALHGWDTHAVRTRAGFMGAFDTKKVVKIEGLDPFELIDWLARS